MSNTSKPTPIYWSEVLTGIFCALVLRGITQLPCYSVRRTTTAFNLLFADLERICREHNLQNRCSKLFPAIDGCSDTMHCEIGKAIQRGLISIDYPDGDTVRLLLSGGEAEKSLEKHLPGPRAIYEELSEIFWRHYIDAQY